MQNNNSGFSILEIIIIIALIGLLGSITLPNLFAQKQSDKVKAFIKNFSILSTKAVTHAVQTNKVVQIYFDGTKKIFFLKEQTDIGDDKNIHEQFKELSTNQQIRVELPDFFEIRNFYINPDDQIQPGAPLKKLWFYAMPTGIVQPVIMNLEYTSDSGQNKKLSVSLTPFLGRVQIHEQFTQP